MVILNQVQVCPLFAALGAFCHPQHIRNIHATWRVARPRNAVIYDVSRFFRAFLGQPALILNGVLPFLRPASSPERKIL